MLNDEVPEVRVVAVQGVCTILSRFWLIIDNTDLQQFMIHIFKHLAFDMASPKVRLAVVKGIAHLIQTCPRSHGYLKKILPKLSDLLFDSNEAVRLGLLDLLLAVKSIKTIPLFRIQLLITKNRDFLNEWELRAMPRRESPKTAALGAASKGTRCPWVFCTLVNYSS